MFLLAEITLQFGEYPSNEHEPTSRGTERQTRIYRLLYQKSQLNDAPRGYDTVISI